MASWHKRPQDDFVYRKQLYQYIHKNLQLTRKVSGDEYDSLCARIEYELYHRSTSRHGYLNVHTLLDRIQQARTIARVRGEAVERAAEHGRQRVAAAAAKQARTAQMVATMSYQSYAAHYNVHVPYASEHEAVMAGDGQCRARLDGAKLSMRCKNKAKKGTNACGIASHKQQVAEHNFGPSPVLFSEGPLRELSTLPCCRERIEATYCAAVAKLEAGAPKDTTLDAEVARLRAQLGDE